MFIVNGIETAYSECWTYNTTKSVIDEFHMPAHLFKHLPNFRYQSLAECWFELGPPDPSYKTGSLLGDGADPRSPWGRARGRLDLREVPAGTTPIRRETILLWTNGIMHEPIEIRRSGPVSNCHLFENSRRLRDNLGCTFEDYKRRKISKANANGRSGYVTASEMKMEIVPFLTFMSRAETVSKDTSQTSGTTAQVQSQLDMKWCKDGVESVFNNLGRMKMMFDTGNTPRTIVSSELNAYLKAARDSDTQFLSAFGPGKTGADKIGTLPMSILGLKPHEETALDLEVTTIESVNTSLMSYYQMFQAGFDLHITAGTAGDSCGDDELPDLVSDDDFLNSKGVLRHRVTGQTIPLFPCRDTRAWYVVFQLDLPNMPDSFTKFVSESCDISRVMTTTPVQMVRDYCEQRHAAPKIASDEGNTAMAMVNLTSEELRAVEQGSKHTLGNKGTVSSKLRHMTKQQHHELYGHLGHFPNCRICQDMARTNRRVSAETEPTMETRPGYLFCMDIITWNFPTQNGEVFFNVLRDVATGYPDGFPLLRKSDLVAKLVPWATKLRAEFGPDHSHPLFRELLLDGDGQQRDDCTEFNQAMDGLPGGACLRTYDCPNRPQAKAIQESAVFDLEMGTKAIMLQQSLPANEWNFAMRDAIWLRQRHPRSSDVKSRDGDAASPLENLSHGRCSRRLINKEKDKFVYYGTVAMCSRSDVRGSDLLNAARSVMAYCCGRVGDVPQWKRFNKETGVISLFRSKDFVVYPLKPGQCYRHVMEGFEIDAPIVCLENPRQMTPSTQPEPESSMPDLDWPSDDAPAAQVPSASDSSTSADTADQARHDHTRISIAEMQKLNSDPGSFVGRDVYQRWLTKDGTDIGVCRGTVADYSAENDVPGQCPWGIRWDDGNITSYSRNEMLQYCLCHIDGTRVTQVIDTDESDSSSDEEESTIDLALQRFQSLGLECYITSDNDTWVNICRALDLQSDTVRRQYYAWLVKHHGYGFLATTGIPHIKMVHPYGKSKASVSQKFPAGIPFPHPRGESWTSLCVRQVDIDRVKDRAEAQGMRCYLTSEADMWADVYKGVGVNRLNRANYLRWLIEEQDYSTGVTERGSAGMAILSQHSRRPDHSFCAGVPFIKPQGEIWDAMVAENGNEDQALHMLRMVGAERAMFCSMSAKADNFDYKFPGMDELNVSDAEVKEVMSRVDEWKSLLPPKTWGEALKRPDAVLWKRSAYKELAVFEELQVMSHGHTAAELDELGLGKRATPLTFVFKVKWHPDGSYEKHKSRLCLCGHPGYMTRGREYPELTYAATPEVSMTRLITVVALLLNWSNVTWDIRSAYLHSCREKCRRLRLKYPKGFDPLDANGDPAQAILLSMLYGNPGVASAWQQTLNDWILEEFNTGGWSAKISEVDAATVILTTPEGNTVILVIWSDDVDSYGPVSTDLDYIASKFQQRFGIVKTNPEFMLGVRRVRTVEEDGSRTLTYSMEEYVADLVDEYEDELPTDTPSMPWPEQDSETGKKVLIGVKQRDYDPSPEEQNEYRERGYLRLVGALLWCCRMCYVEMGFALSQLCSVMSKPSEKAWKLALRALKWLSVNAKIGLQYNTAKVTGYGAMQFAANELHVYHDSGHNQFDDGRAQYGNALMLAGGAVSFVSKKHATVGDSTCSNEYMSGYHAAKRAKEAKNLLIEIGGDAAALVAKPIRLCGDNDAATSIATERRPARHIELKYHYTRELVRQGDVIHVRVPSKDNRADIQTKPVSRAIFRWLAPLLKGCASL